MSNPRLRMASAEPRLAATRPDGQVTGSHLRLVGPESERVPESVPESVRMCLV